MQASGQDQSTPVVPAMQASGQVPLMQASGQDEDEDEDESEYDYLCPSVYDLVPWPVLPTGPSVYDEFEALMMIRSAELSMSAMSPMNEVDLEESSNGSMPPMCDFADAAMSVSEDESGSAAVFIDIVFFVMGDIGHPWPWRAHGRERHWGAEGRYCSQSCGCCRARNAEDWPSGCGVCLDLYALSLVNKLIRRAVAWQANAHQDKPYLWVCPTTRSADGESSTKRWRTGSAEEWACSGSAEEWDWSGSAEGWWSERWW